MFAMVLLATTNSAVAANKTPLANYSGQVQPIKAADNVLIPTLAAISGQVCVHADTAGVLTPTSGDCGGAAGTTGQIQYNNAGVLAGSANFTFNGTTVTAANDVLINSITIGKGGGNVGYNAAVGLQALAANTTGVDNTAIGYLALTANTTGYYNTAIGSVALYVNTTGFDNTAIGLQALAANTIGAYNTAVGSAALIANTIGITNAAIGFQAGYDITTGSYNTVIGAYPTTGVGITTGNYNMLIGYDVRPPSQTANRQLNIGNLIYGFGLGSGSGAATGGIGIGTASPGAKLEVTNSYSGTAQGGQVYITNSYSSGAGTRVADLTFNLTDSVGTKKPGAMIQTLSNNGDSSSGANLLFYTRTADAAPTEKARIDNNGNLQMGGANTVIDLNRLIMLRPYTVAALPTPGAAGALAMVTDALAPSFLVAVTGGGATKSPVFYDGATWRAF